MPAGIIVNNIWHETKLATCNCAYLWYFRLMDGLKPGHAWAQIVRHCI